MNNEIENATNSPEESREPKATPFFARFLEGPQAQADPNTTSMTLKYPSDRDEIDYVE